MPEEPARACGPRLILAFDFGLKRIGVARGDTLSAHASPLGAIAVTPGAPPWESIGTLLQEWQPAMAVVGLPYNADGSEGSMTVAARAFAAGLKARFALEVDLVDERYSSLDAEARLKGERAAGRRRGRIGRSDIDAAAACVILERWFSGQG